MRYLDPKADLTFKRVFGEHPELVKSLLNALLPLDEDQPTERKSTPCKYDTSYIIGYIIGYLEGEHNARIETARMLKEKFGMTDEQISQATSLSIVEIREFNKND